MVIVMCILLYSIQKLEVGFFVAKEDALNLSADFHFNPQCLLGLLGKNFKVGAFS